jgi:hypothetical protein
MEVPERYARKSSHLDDQVLCSEASLYRLGRVTARFTPFTVYKKTAKPRNTLPQSAAMVIPALGTKRAAAAPPCVDELEPVV